MFSAQLNQLLHIAGTNNKYQFIVLFIFTIIFITTDFFVISLPHLEMSPYVNITYTNNPSHKDYMKLNYDTCQMKANNTIDFTIDTIINPQSSLVIDMASYCDKNLTSLIGISIFGGLIVGSCLASLVVDRFGRKNAIVIVYPIYIGVVITFFIVPNYNWLIFLFLSVIGFLGAIINIAVITYICEIIKHDNIEVYITILISGSPIGGFIFNYFFYICRVSNWRFILFGVGGLGLIAYVIVLIYVGESPIYYLNNGNVNQFKENLNGIARKNNTLILDEDLEFLDDVIDQNKKIPAKDSPFSSYSDHNNINTAHEEGFLKARDSRLNNQRSPSLIERSSVWKMTMSNYSPFDLIRYKSQLTNFFVLSFLWGLNTIILHGLDIFSRNTEYKEIKSYHIVSAIFDFVNLLGDIFIIIFIMLKRFDPHHFLQCFQLISLTLFLISLGLKEDLDSTGLFSIILLYLSKMCWNSTYTIIYIISAKIYPSMLRSKGMSYNKAIGVVFGLGGPYLIENNMNRKDFIVYFILLTFFGIIFTYVLPEEYESIYQVPENEMIDNKNGGNRGNGDNGDDLPTRNSMIFTISEANFDAKVILDDSDEEESKLNINDNSNSNSHKGNTKSNKGKPEDNALII